MNARQKTTFIKTVYGYYEQFGRHDLPWRLTNDPYRIIVSEIMLQQTQVGRVREKYQEFLKAFPTVQILADASLQQVLVQWSGLGYNRRARFLHQMAQTVVKEYKGAFPKSFEGLLELPGIGQYTAGAVCAFAYNIPVAIIETNIRTVYLHYFFKDNTEKVSDKELMALITETMDHANPRQWYWALMDYGSHLKQRGITIHRNSMQYTKQSAFKGSLREVRGGILKVLTAGPATSTQLQKTLSFEKERIDKALVGLVKEQFITKKMSTYSIA